MPIGIPNPECTRLNKISLHKNSFKYFLYNELVFLMCHSLILIPCLTKGLLISLLLLTLSLP